MKVLPRVHETVAAYYNAFRGSASVKLIELFMSDNPYFGRYPSSGALKSYVCERSEVEEALRGGYRASCDGRRLSVDTTSRI